jgi:hypothetical protein
MWKRCRRLYFGRRRFVECTAELAQQRESVKIAHVAGDQVSAQFDDLTPWSSETAPRRGEDL